MQTERCGDGIAVPALAFGWCSVQGRRERNEDFVAFHGGDTGALADHGFVAAIADGVGGHRGGREAAETTVRGFIDAQSSQSPLRSMRDRAALALNTMNQWIHAVGRTDEALDGMATTFTGLILHGRIAHVVHVGDSRLYCLRDGRISRLTTDHASDRPGQSHMLTRAIGLSDELAIATATEPVQVHDRFLLCTDGVHGVLSDAGIARVLAQGDPSLAAQRLVQAALAARSTDNVSVAVVDVEALPPAQQDELMLALSGLDRLADPQVGHEVDGFRLERLLARGRHARVFVARDLIGEFGDVVLKFPAGPDEAARRMVLREEWIGLRVRSPWLAAPVPLPADRRQTLYAVQAYHPGETLDQRLRRSPPLSLGAGLAIGIRLGKAVAALHRAGVIHRDIKPENVQLEPGGGVRLLDLGVALVSGLTDQTARGAGAPDMPDNVPGTASYMAPELLAGGNAGDAGSDLYALGVTLYRAWSGAWPYGETEPFQRPQFGRATPLATYRPDLPRWLGAVLARAVAVRPDERQDDVVELILELEHGAEMPELFLRGRMTLLMSNPVRFWQAVSLLLALMLLGVGLKQADW
ncbi:MAG: bifunctional protein-serine/threonine kinase/phosphatase [Janthinobacterium lividum]